MSAIFQAKTAVARGVGALSRASGRGGGTTLPGRVLERMAPDAIERLAARLPEGCAVVSATNGKTTTTAMASRMLAPQARLARNVGGANLVSGITSALLQMPRGAELGLFEVDEFALPEVVRRARPRVLALGNLFRDQLDRYGELELIAERWRAMLDAAGPQARLVLGADDPAVAELGRGRDAVYVGFDDPRHALAVREDAADSTFCVRCGSALDYAAVYLGHLGAWSCPNCDAARPALDFAIRDVEQEGLTRTRFVLATPEGDVPAVLELPGVYNLYNAALAVALAWTLGVQPRAAVERLAGFSAAFGRFERVDVGGVAAVLLLIKNPAGANEALRTLRGDLDGRPLFVALNDRTADGRDVSWIWDVDFEDAAPLAGRVVCSGTRAADLALRMKYAGVAAERIEVIDDLEEAFDRAIALGRELGGTAYALPTYTAMLTLRGIITDRGLTAPYWQEQA